MAAKRRRPARKPRTTSSRESFGGEPVRVSFIGEEIRRAIDRINDQAANLPRQGRLAAKVAEHTLRLCSIRIQKAVNCDFWVFR